MSNLAAYEQGLSALLDNPEDIALLTDLQGHILYANKTVCSQHNCQLAELQGRVIFDLFPEPEAQFRRAIFEWVLQYKAVRRLDDLSNGRVYDSTISPIFDDSGQIVRMGILARDVTEQRRMARAIEEARNELEQRVQARTRDLARTNAELKDEIDHRFQVEQKLLLQARHTQTLVRVAGRINAHLNLDDMLMTICQETQHALGYAQISVSLFNPGDDKLVAAVAIGPGAELQDQCPAVTRAELEHYRAAFGPMVVIPDRRMMPLLADNPVMNQVDIRTVVACPIVNQGELIGIISLASVSEIQAPDTRQLEFLQTLAELAAAAIANARLFQQGLESQQRLRVLSAQLVNIQEAERQKLAYELHEEIGQSLTALNLELEVLRRSFDHGSPDLSQASQSVQQLQCEIQNLLRQVRDISHTLHPALLDDLGLLPALLYYLERYIARTGVNISFKHSGLEQRFGAERELTLYRVVQDTLENIAGHAHIANFNLHIWRVNQHVRLQIEIPNRFLNQQELVIHQNGNNIASLHERLLTYGGRLEIEIQPAGVCMVVELPVGDDN